MTRFLTNTAAAFAALFIVGASMTAIVTIPPAQAEIAAPTLA